MSRSDTHAHREGLQDKLCLCSRCARAAARGLEDATKLVIMTHAGGSDDELCGLHCQAPLLCCQLPWVNAGTPRLYARSSLRQELPRPKERHTRWRTKKQEYAVWICPISNNNV
eukprot:4679869-Amphidinium_carterae.1